MKSSIIKSTRKDKLVVVRSVENMMVLDLDDVLLVCPRDDKAIKDIVTDLSMKDKDSVYL